MKPKKRIIFTLLYNSGQFALSRNFRLQSIGDSEWLQKNYNFDNVSFHIDELLIFDVSRNKRDKQKFCQQVKKLSENIFVPLTVGGGINSIEDAILYFNSGADKVSLNTSLFRKPYLARDICKVYGRQCLIGSLDILYKDNEFNIYTENGQTLVGSLNTFLEKNVVLEDIGELYINSINQDGTGNGLDIQLLKLVKEKSKLPFIIAGGIGKVTDIREYLCNESIDALGIAHLLNFIGDSLCKTRVICRESGVKLANWPDLSQLNQSSTS
tara:strand:- start:407 stop:1213 length:807 start_codon:yes stop_codon:yes gene_type:complete